MELAVTITGPEPAFDGTTATIWLFDQLVMELAGTPLKVTVPLPCEPPKFEPLMVTAVPMVPNVGANADTIGIVPLTFDSLSKVADARFPVAQLQSPNPMSTV